MYDDDAGFWTMVAFLAVGLALCVGYAIWESKLNRECKELGYREAQVAWFLEPFCVTRSEQTDLVVPMRELREEE